MIAEWILRLIGWLTREDGCKEGTEPCLGCSQDHWENDMIA